MCTCQVGPRLAILAAMSLTSKQQRYVDGISAGLTPAKAAKAAGTSAAAMKRNPIVGAELALISERARDRAVYTTERAMSECLEAMRYAKECENPGAFVRAIELRARLSGLLIDRVEVVHIDIAAAIDRARVRVVEIRPAIA